MKNLLIITMGIMTLLFSSCGVKVRKMADDAQRNIVLDSAFTAIESRGIIDIEYIASDKYATSPTVVLTGPEDRLKYVEIYVENGKLIVDNKPELQRLGNMTKMGDVKLTLTYSGVNSFSTIGTGDIEIPSLKTESATFTTLGTGDLKCKYLKSSLLHCDTRGTGDIDIKKADCTNAILRTTGTGDIEISVITAEDISADNTGTGDITIAGTCTTTTFNNTGSGEINSDNLHFGVPADRSIP